MGVQVPFFGYVVGRGRSHLRSSRTAATNRKNIEAIEQFGSRCAAVPGRRYLVQGDRPLKDWCPTGGLFAKATTFVTSTRLEHDLHERLELRALLDERAQNGVGSVVIPTIAHFRDEALTQGMLDCLRRIKEENVPVIVLETEYEKEFVNLRDEEIDSRIISQTLDTWTMISRLLAGRGDKSSRKRKSDVVASGSRLLRD